MTNMTHCKGGDGNSPFQITRGVTLRCKRGKLSNWVPTNKGRIDDDRRVDGTQRKRPRRIPGQAEGEQWVLQQTIGCQLCKEG